MFLCWEELTIFVDKRWQYCLTETSEQTLGGFFKKAHLPTLINPQSSHQQAMQTINLPSNLPPPPHSNPLPQNVLIPAQNNLTFVNNPTGRKPLPKLELKPPKQINLSIDNICLLPSRCRLFTRYELFVWKCI